MQFQAPVNKTQIVTFNVPAPWWWIILPIVQALALVSIVRPVGLEWPILSTQIVITSFASWRLFCDGRPYSLNKVWWLFTIVFLGIIPSLQLAVHTMPWHTGDIKQSTMLRANGLILLCLGTFEYVRMWVSKNFRPKAEMAPLQLAPKLVRQFSLWAPIIVCICGAFLLAVLGWRGLLLRGHMESALWQHSTSFQLLFDKGIRGTILWCCLAGIVLYRQHKLPLRSLLLILIPAFIFNFPLALPRYMALTFYLSWGLAAGLNFFRQRYSFSLCILALFVFVAPLTSITRYTGEVLNNRMAHPSEVFQKAVLVTDYDAWSSLCRTIQYCDSAGSTQGQQLLGVSLFFVPRNVWPNKPIGSGAFLFNELGLGFNNVACTFLAEGYINFGFMGSLVFAIILAFCIARFDAWYWRRGGRMRFTLPRLFYAVCVGMLFFILRGDLLSSFAYTTGFAAIFLFWQIIFFWRIDKKTTGL